MQGEFRFIRQCAVCSRHLLFFSFYYWRKGDPRPWHRRCKRCWQRSERHRAKRAKAAAEELERTGKVTDASEASPSQHRQLTEEQ